MKQTHTKQSLHEKQERSARLTKLTDRLIGSINIKTHPVWKNERKIEQWRKEIRTSNEQLI